MTGVPAFAPYVATRYAWQRNVPATAGVPRRAVAFIVDSIIIFAASWTLVFIAATLGWLRIPDIRLLGQVSEAAGLLWIVAIFEAPLTLLYFSLLEGFRGRTPGKLLAGIRVVRVDGGRPSFFEVFLRNLLRLLWVTPFGPAFFLLDAWVLGVTELDQRVGDVAAGTLVVHASGSPFPGRL